MQPTGIAWRRATRARCASPSRSGADRAAWAFGQAHHRSIPRTEQRLDGRSDEISSRAHARARAFCQSTGRSWPQTGHLGTTRGHGRERARTASGRTRDHLVTTGRWAGHSGRRPGRHKLLTRPDWRDGWRGCPPGQHVGSTAAADVRADGHRTGWSSVVYCATRGRKAAARQLRARPSATARPPGTQSRLIGARSDRWEALADAAPKLQAPRRANGCNP